MNTLGPTLPRTSPYGPPPAFLSTNPDKDSRKGAGGSRRVAGGAEGSVTEYLSRYRAARGSQSACPTIVSLSSTEYLSR